MKTLADFLFTMESCPSTLADPHYGFTPEEIVAFAAEIRDKANLPRPDPYINPHTGDVLPADWNPLKMRYSGDCNGCGSPIYIDPAWYPDE